MSTINAAGTALTVDELTDAIAHGRHTASLGSFDPIEVAISPDVVAESWDATVTAVAAGLGGVELTVQLDRAQDEADALTEFIRELTECANIGEVRNVLNSARTHGELRRYFP
jgi:hypothetical protein